MLLLMETEGTFNSACVIGLITIIIDSEVVVFILSQPKDVWMNAFRFCSKGDSNRSSGAHEGILSFVVVFCGAHSQSCIAVA